MVKDSTLDWCVQGTEAEFAGKLDQALFCAQQAWQAATTAYDHCIAAHYLGRFTTELTTRLHWHQQAVEWSKQCQPEQIKALQGSLWINLAYALEELGRLEQAREWYAKAYAIGWHSHDPRAAYPR